jgi:hypothetical protein
MRAAKDGAFWPNEATPSVHDDARAKDYLHVWSNRLYCFRIVIYNENRNRGV